MNSLISVIIPIYNVEQYLEEAVNSVRNQSYNNLEIILVNDGSTDNSGILCDELASKDNRIKVVHKKNGGLSSTRNIGIDNASGDFIFFLDGDDFIDKKTIEILINQFKDNQIGIVSAPCFYSYKEGKKSIYNKDWDIKENRIIFPQEFCRATLTQKICFSACCKLYRKDLLNKVRFRLGKKNEDTLFMFDLSSYIETENIKMLEVANKLYYYRVNVGSISRNAAFPIKIDYIVNLNNMMHETSNNKTKKCIKSIYFNEIVSFKSILFLDENFRKGIHKDAIKTFNKHYSDTNFINLIQYASVKNVIKYLFIKYIPFIYHFIYNLK